MQKLYKIEISVTNPWGGYDVTYEIPRFTVASF